MSFQTTIIAGTTAVAIALGAVAPTSVAAAPFAASSSAAADFVGATDAVELVQHRRGKRHFGRRARRRAGAAAIIGLGAFALGAAVASQNQAARRYCFRERVRVWSPRYQRHIIVEEVICR